MRIKIIVAALITFPLIVFAQGDSKKQAYFFFLPSCPHCINVEKYFDDNGIWDKYQITKMDASNPFNGRLLMKFQDIFKSPNKGSVPAIAFGDKFFEGDQPIISNFVKEIDASDNANILPDPDKATTVAVSDKQPATSNNSAAGNKNKWISVIVLVGIVVVGGILFLKSKKP